MTATRVREFNFRTKIKSLADTSSPAFTTRLSLLVCIFLTLLGLIVGYLENSLAVFTNGLLSGIDIINSGIFLLAVNRSMKSPDYIFNYGYGKYESLSLLLGTGFLMIIMVYTLVGAIDTILEPSPKNGNYFLLISTSLLSLFIMLFMYRLQRKSAKKHKMTILEFDSELWKTDSIIEIVVLLNLIAGLGLAFFGFIKGALILDSVIAIIVLGYAIKVPLKGSKEALGQLLDRTLPESEQLLVMRIIAESNHLMCGFNSVHTRRSGKDIFIEIDVILPFDSSISEKFEAEDLIKEKVREDFPTAVTRLYAIPCNKSCILDADNRRCPIHKLNNKIEKQ
ncbi:MAG: hypothetical protein Kapaf2KO_15420 [Candidatus Kapaibacteriales bacterium]